MSTRATYSFKNQDDLKSTETFFYIHYDGYPEGAATYFYAMLACENKRGSYADKFLRSNPLAELTRNHELHGDTEYQYSFVNNLLVASKCYRNWKFPENDSLVTIFTGTLDEFIHKYGRDSQDSTFDTPPHVLPNLQLYQDAKKELEILHSQYGNEMLNRATDLEPENEYIKTLKETGNANSTRRQYESMKQMLKEYKDKYYLVTGEELNL